MLDHVVAAYTFSKSYSMSGWRIGFAVGPSRRGRGDRQADQHDGLVQPPVRPAWPPTAALEQDAATRDDYMGRFRRKVERLVDGPAADRRVRRSPRRPGRSTSSPTSGAICNRLGITSHGLALYLLEGADDDFGVACLGGECFGEAGRGLPPVQLRRARRADRPGPRLPARGARPGRPGREVPRRPSRSSASPSRSLDLIRPTRSHPEGTRCRPRNDRLEVEEDHRSPGPTRRSTPGPRGSTTSGGSTRVGERSSTRSAPAGWSPGPTGSARWSGRSSASRSPPRPPPRSTGGSATWPARSTRPGPCSRSARPGSGACGLSGVKARYVLNLAEAVRRGHDPARRGPRLGGRGDHRRPDRRSRGSAPGPPRCS